MLVTKLELSLVIKSLLFPSTSLIPSLKNKLPLSWLVFSSLTTSLCKSHILVLTNLPNSRESAPLLLFTAPSTFKMKEFNSLFNALDTLFSVDKSWVLELLKLILKLCWTFAEALLNLTPRFPLKLLLERNSKKRDWTWSIPSVEVLPRSLASLLWAIRVINYLKRIVY